MMLHAIQQKNELISEGMGDKVAVGESVRKN
jgi:hypothetical protein